MYEIIDCLRRIAIAIERLSKNDLAVEYLEQRLSDLKREFSGCKTQFEFNEFECKHLAIDELEKVLINLKELK